MCLNAKRIRRRCIKQFIPAAVLLLSGNAASGADLNAAKPALPLKQPSQQELELDETQRQRLKNKAAPSASPSIRPPALQQPHSDSGSLQPRVKKRGAAETLKAPGNLKPDSTDPALKKSAAPLQPPSAPAVRRPGERELLSAPGRQPGGNTRLKAPDDVGKTPMPQQPAGAGRLRNSIDKAEPPERRARRVITREEADRNCARGVWDCDRDGDGHRAAKYHGDDCNDDDANTFPGNAEVADFRGHDEDCDPSTIDSGTRLHAASGDGDKDKDTFIDERVANYGYGHHVPRRDEYISTRRGGRAYYHGTDCDDTDPAIHPQQIEVCNERDDNCNGEIDDGLLNCPTGR